MAEAQAVAPATATAVAPEKATRAAHPEGTSSAGGPARVAAPPEERVAPAADPDDRPMSPEELSMERDRIYARLTAVPNVVSRPSPADYVVFEVGDPDVVMRKLVGLGVPQDVVQKYPKVPNGMRVFVRSARRNELFLRALEQAVK